MSYIYTAVAVYYDPDDPKRFKNLTKTPTVTAKDLSTGNTIAGASVSNVDTGNYKVSVTFASKESVLFKVIPHNDDKDDFPDVSLLAEEVIFIADDILADTGDLKTRLTATRAGYIDKLNVAGTLANTNNASSFKADVTGIPAAVWGYATRTLSSFGTLISDIWSFATRTLSAFGFTVATNSDAKVTAIKAQTDKLPNSPAAVGDAMTLTSAYDAAKSAASQTSVNAIPTTPLLAGNYTAPDNAGITAIKAQTDKLPNSPAAKGDKMMLDTNALDANAIKADAVTKLQNGLMTTAAYVEPDNTTIGAIDTNVETILDDYARRTGDYAPAGEYDNQLDAKVSSRLAGASYVAPDNAGITAIKAKTDKLPNSPAATGDAMTLTSTYDNAKDDVLTPLATVDGKADAIKAKTDKIPNTPAEAGEYTSALTAIKGKTDNLPVSPAPAGEYDARLTTIQSDLDNPGQYKADVSGLAKTTDLTGLAEKTDLSGLAKTTDLTGLAEKTDLSGLAKTTDLSGLAKATDLSGLAEKTDIPSDYAKVADLSGLATSAEISALNDITAVDVLAEEVIGGYSLAQVLTALAAKSHGLASGGGTTIITYGGIDGTPGVIVETVDEDGNRSKVELDL